MTDIFRLYVKQKREEHSRKGAIVVPMASEMTSRWNSRVLPRRLHEMGFAGAGCYLSDYGKRIQPPKCISLALKAETENCASMAVGFWTRAYELETGQKVGGADIQDVEAPDQLTKG